MPDVWPGERKLSLWQSGEETSNNFVAIIRADRHEIPAAVATVAEALLSCNPTRRRLLRISSVALTWPGDCYPARRRQPKPRSTAFREQLHRELSESDAALEMLAKCLHLDAI